MSVILESPKAFYKNPEGEISGIFLLSIGSFKTQFFCKAVDTSGKILTIHRNSIRIQFNTEGTKEKPSELIEVGLNDYLSLIEFEG